VKLTTYLHLVPRSKNAWSYSSTPPIRLHGVVLSKKKHRGNFNFTFTFYPLLQIVGLGSRDKLTLSGTLNVLFYIVSVYFVLTLLRNENYNT